MKELFFLAALIVDPVNGQISARDIQTSSQPKIQVAATCFKSGEQKSGSNKICYYNCLGGTVAINVGALEFCPMSIKN